MREHVRVTDSQWSRSLLDDWGRTLRDMWQVVPREMLTRLAHPLEEPVLEAAE